MDFSMPAFPDLTPSTTYSFTSAYAEVLAPPAKSNKRSRSNSTAQHNRRRTSRAGEQANLQPRQLSGSGAGSSLRDEDRLLRAGRRENGSAGVRRMLEGKRKVGTEVTKESEELSDQEEAVYHAELALKTFGYSFLLPPGRRQTQAEQDYPTSPTPSSPTDPNQDPGPAQEDQAVGSPGAEEEIVPDLDADIEDRDAEGTVEEGETGEAMAD